VDKVASPDIPAYVCYLIVLLVGMIVAASSVNRLLATQPGHWAFMETWLLFFAYSALPVVLFWFLDYTGAIRDTSLFAALVVAVGYQQVIAGGVQGIDMAGETSRLWQPFEKWVQGIAARIARRSKRFKDKFEERVVSYIIADPQRTEALRALAIEYSVDGNQLSADLKVIDDQALPVGMAQNEFERFKNRRRVEYLEDSLRASRPETFHDLLRKNRLVDWKNYWRFRNLQSTLAAGVGIALLFAAVIVAWICFSNEASQLRYHEWRFVRANSSDIDRFRAREYLGEHLEKLAADPGKESEIKQAISRMIARLRYKAVMSQLSADIERFVVDNHSRAVDAVVIPQLIMALQNENSDIRLHIHETLVALHKEDFEDTKLPQELEAWVPQKDESPHVIACHIREWKNWWKLASSKTEQEQSLH